MCRPIVVFELAGLKHALKEKWKRRVVAMEPLRDL